MIFRAVGAVLAGLIAGQAVAEGQLVTVLAHKPHSSIEISDYYGAFDCTSAGSNGTTVFAMIDDKAMGPAGKDISKPGQVAFIWGRNQKRTYWGKAAPAGAGVKLTFADRKPVMLEMTRAKPTSEDDFKPFVKVTEDGQVYQCGYSQQ